jgi:Protein of unknown function (DUF998)
MVRRLSEACIAAQVLFVVLWLVAAAWQPAGYSVVEHTISDMYAKDAPHGAWVAAVFTVCGVVTMAFALLVVPRVLRPSGWWGRSAALLLALSILGLGGALSFLEREGCQLATPGCSASDQMEGGGTADAVLSGVGLLLLLAAGFVLAAAFKRVPGWGRYAWPARWFSIILLVLLVATGVADAVDLGGLFQRIAAAFAAAGMAELALLARRHGEPAATVVATPGVVE